MKGVPRIRKVIKDLLNENGEFDISRTSHYLDMQVLQRIDKGEASKEEFKLIYEKYRKLDEARGKKVSEMQSHQALHEIKQTLRNNRSLGNKTSHGREE